jgi:hypothetical protein
VNMTTDTLEPESQLSGGLCLPNKERVLYRPPESKSVLGTSFSYHALYG